MILVDLHMIVTNLWESGLIIWGKIGLFLKRWECLLIFFVVGGVAGSNLSLESMLLAHYHIIVCDIISIVMSVLGSGVQVVLHLINLYLLCRIK